MNVSEFIFDYLNNRGVNQVFMVTGGQAMWLNDAVGKNKNYNIICTHHEQSAAMAADSYGRIKGKPAVCLVTAGPGAMNALNGVAGGYTDSSPMIIISGQANLSFVKYQEDTSIRQYGVQGINIKHIVEPIVKYFQTIDKVEKLKYYLDKAYTLATSGRPGPVWLEVPLDIQKTVVNPALFVNVDFDNDIKVDSPTETINLFAKKLQSAKRPLILAGQGVALSGGRSAFTKMVNKLQIPVITARLGIDLIESDNRLYVGRPGNYGERAANFAVQNADLLIVIGCRLASSLVGHSPKMFAKNAYKIVVDIDKKELEKPGVDIDKKLCCDCKIFMETLNELIDDYDIPSFENWISRCNYWKNKYPVCLPEYKKENKVNSYYFLDKLSSHADSNASILIDTGSCFHVACQTWKVKKGQTFLTTGGLSSMGYWVACLGSCMANDRKQTIVVTGDGSYQMNIQEMATISHNKLPIKIFILNNNGYLLIRHTQHNFMNDRFVGEGPNTGVWCPDSKKIAQAYDMPFYRIENVNQIDSVLNDVFSNKGPVLCEVMTPEWQLLIPRITSEKMPDGSLVAHDYEDMYPFLPREELKENMTFDEEAK